MKLMIIKSARECKPFPSAQSNRRKVVETLQLHHNKNRLRALGQGFFAWGDVFHAAGREVGRDERVGCIYN